MIKKSPIIWGLASACLICSGLARAYFTPESAPPPPQTAAQPGLLLAGMLLIEENGLPGDETEAVSEAPQQEATIKRPNPTEAINSQSQQAGEVIDSQVTGQIRARGLIHEAQQAQSGRANVQSMEAAVVRGAHVVGDAHLRGQINQGNQYQVGTNNQQGISVGGIR